MTVRLLLLLALLAALPRLPAAEPYAAALSDAARARLAALAAPRTLSAAFTESRFTPLKRDPVVVRGTVRIDRARGLSLAYEQPGSPVVILDDKGLLLRRSDGREQAAPPEAGPDLRLLHALFAFDLATLEKTYALVVSEPPAEGPAGNGNGAWTLTFTRLPDATASYRELTLSGEATRLTFIRLAKTPNLKTEIAIAPPTPDPVFSPGELARYFR